MFIAISTIISGLRRGLARIDGWRWRLGQVRSGMDGLDGVGAQGEGCFVRDPVRGGCSMPALRGASGPPHRTGVQTG